MRVPDLKDSAKIQINLIWINKDIN